MGKVILKPYVIRQKRFYLGMTIYEIPYRCSDSTGSFLYNSSIGHGRYGRFAAIDGVFDFKGKSLAKGVVEL